MVIEVDACIVGYKRAFLNRRVLDSETAGLNRIFRIDSEEDDDDDDGNLLYRYHYRHQYNQHCYRHIRLY